MYRDDRDALLLRAEALERELAETRAEVVAQDTQLESAGLERAAQQRELEHLRARLAKLEPTTQPRQTSGRAMVLAGAIAVAMAGAGAAVFLLSKPEKPVSEPAIKSVPQASPLPVPRPSLDDGVRSLSRQQVRNGIAKVRPAVSACGRRQSESRADAVTVVVTLTVAPTGEVTTVKRVVDDELSRCIEAVLLQARFEPTERGRTFQYPFYFSRDAAAER